jgi:hypothetical protein
VRGRGAASGLFYLAEWVEEYTVLTKKVIRGTIIAIAVLHVLLMILENLPPLYLLLGLVAHATYFSLLPSFPFIEFSDPRFIASIGTCSTRSRPVSVYLKPECLEALMVCMACMMRCACTQRWRWAITACGSGTSRSTTIPSLRSSPSSCSSSGCVRTYLLLLLLYYIIHGASLNSHTHTLARS